MKRFATDRAYLIRFRYTIRFIIRFNNNRLVVKPRILLRIDWIKRLTVSGDQMVLATVLAPLFEARLEVAVERPRLYETCPIVLSVRCGLGRFEPTHQYPVTGFRFILKTGEKSGTQPQKAILNPLG